MANPNVTKWIPPLPPGWEGRWDANQRTYFFIDHATKKTSWEDPRYSSQATAQPPFPPQKSLYKSKDMPGISTEPTFVKQDTMANKIHMDYPRVPLDTIADIVSACNLNEQEARIMLTRMGYQKGGEANSHSSLKTEQPAFRPKSPAKGKAKSPSRSPARSPTPPKSAPKPVSEAEKKRILSKLKSEFPALDSVVVTMALDVCEYKEDQARIILKSWGDNDKGGSKAQSRPMSGSKTTEAAALSSSSLEPVPFGDDGRPSSRRSDARPSSSNKSSQPRSGQPKKTTSVATTHPGHKRNKPTHVTKQTQPSNHVVINQPRAISTNRTPTSGPNTGLRMGPDKTILLSEYTLVHGPNPSNRQGPEPSRSSGAQGATGPDPMNHCGSEALVNSRPQASYQSFLVTSI
ncbi:BAG family molecular chaperone regulator 3-like isoform X2 [Mizuhopecten yessoensis]|uniref:BAG family molecular chaperone regulator 3-like isoform X2 n=1 Tax=Mizuhopecten yessoensis TaxID=6573 RepID=UPI000B4587DA|nr:BAG family molecular chaperone regulator 3-like isoform X2 [Mizuhopecten yessoensis]